VAQTASEDPDGMLDVTDSVAARVLGGLGVTLADAEAVLSRAADRLER
jgi:hypothetical protein